MHIPFVWRNLDFLISGQTSAIFMADCIFGRYGIPNWTANVEYGFLSFYKRTLRGFVDKDLEPCLCSYKKKLFILTFQPEIF